MIPKNYTILPKTKRQDAKVKYGNSENWKNFSHRMLNNPFVKQYIMQRYQYKCAFCGRSLYYGNIQIHHSDYDHACITDQCIQIPAPVTNRKEHVYRVPDCANCSQEHLFECVKHLHPVHAKCHRKLHIVSGDLKKF